MTIEHQYIDGKLSIRLGETNVSGVGCTDDKLCSNVNGYGMYIDNITPTLIYDPFSGILSSDILVPTNQFTTTFSVNTLTLNLKPSTFQTSSCQITGIANTISRLVFTGFVLNGLYRIGILNSGTGTLTISAGTVLTTNSGISIKTVHTSNVSIATGRTAIMSIEVIQIAGVTVYILQVVQLT